MVCPWEIFGPTSAFFIPLLDNLFFIHLGENEGGKKLEGEVGKSWPGGDRTQGGDTGSTWVSFLRNARRNFCFCCNLPTASNEACIFPQTRCKIGTGTCGVSYAMSVKSMGFFNLFFTFLSKLNLQYSLSLYWHTCDFANYIMGHMSTRRAWQYSYISKPFCFHSGLTKYRLGHTSLVDGKQWLSVVLENSPSDQIL